MKQVTPRLAHPRLEVLRRLLAAPPLLEVLDDASQISAFLEGLLRQVPGVADVHICYRDTALSDDGQTARCATCQRSRLWEAGGHCCGQRFVNAEKPARSMRHNLVLHNRRGVYGYVALVAGNLAQFQVYEPYLSTILALTSSMLENSVLHCVLRDATHRLDGVRSAQDDTVAARTDHLAHVNQQLENEVRERKRAEERANGFALYARSLIESCPDPIIILTIAGQISDLNTAAERAIGLTRYRLIGAHFYESFSDPAIVAAIGRQVFASGAVRDQHLCLRHLCGRRMDVLFTAAVFHDDRGHVAGAIAVLRDITDRVRAERELANHRRILQTLIDATEDTIALLDVHGCILACNEALAVRFETRPHRLTGIVLGDLFPPDEAEAHRAAIACAITQGQPVHRVVQAPDGSVFETSLYPVADRCGAITAVTVQSRDITGQRNHEIALELARVAAERASDAKSCFLASMSHELRTPLNAILGFSEILQQEMFGPLGNRKYVEYVQDIHESGEHLLELIQDILDISKIEAGRMEIEPRRINVRALISDCQRLMSERADHQGVTLTHGALSPELEMWVDERAIRQIIFNLLSNSIKFTPSGGAITVTAAAVDEEESGGWGGLELVVSDTGVGIAPEDLGRIMVPFQRADNRYGRAAGGTGLGLALVKGLVELHRGRVVIESQLGCSTTVTLWFPSRP